VPDTS